MPDYLRQCELVNSAGIPVEMRDNWNYDKRGIACRIPGTSIWTFLASRSDVEHWDVRSQLAPLVLKVLYGGKQPDMGNTVEDKAADIGYKWGVGFRGLIGSVHDPDSGALQFIAMRLARLEGYADMDSGYAFISAFVKGFEGRENNEKFLS